MSEDKGPGRAWSPRQLRLARGAVALAVDGMVAYLLGDPGSRLDRLVDTIGHFVRDPVHRRRLEGIRRRVVKDTAIQAQARRVLTNPTVVRRVVANWAINQLLLAPAQRKAAERRLGVHVPNLLLIDPTSACNLRCTGCWAAGYHRGPSLSPDRFDRLLNEAKAMGIYWFVLSGGEPFAYKPLLDVVGRHLDATFMAYTNGTLIDDRTADRLAELGNFSPAISLEGWREQTDARRGRGVFDQVVAAMDRLRHRGVIFGASVTVTQHNAETLFSDPFIQFLAQRGATYLWSFHYVPVGPGADLEAMITPSQRAWLVRRVREIRETHPIFVADFWNDGHFTGGCIAGGRMYLHVTASGDVEPCAFVHFATHNIHRCSLAEALKSPLFTEYQRRIPFCPNHLAPCPIIDNPVALREMVRVSGAQGTHEGADAILSGERAAFLDDLSARWHAMADALAAYPVGPGEAGDGWDGGGEVARTACHVSSSGRNT